MSRQRRPSSAGKNEYRNTGFGAKLGNFIALWTGRFIPIVLLLLALVIGYFGASFYFQAKDLPDVATLEKYEPIEAIQILDRNDHLVCLVEGDENRQVVPLNQISIPMQRAMLAAEDHHFFEHHGINVASIFRALMVNAQAGHVVEGGSTITQQLVKNLFFTQAGRTYNRKFKEVILAFELEQRYPKEKILELYLNQIYFGSNAYGIERAAARYFNTTALKLNLAQSAFLAGLVKAPSELGSPHNRAQAIARQHEILDKMVEYGYILPVQKKVALAHKLVFRNGANPFSRYPYYISYVLQILHEKYSENEIRKNGLRVYTNLDQTAEQIAENTLDEAIKHAPKGVSQAALVTISVADGAVLALVGGVGDFWKNQFNRATNPHTVGSSFKPFVYLTAFLEGQATPDSTIDDSPLVVHQGWGMPDYIPKNFDHKFYGHIPVRKALALSRNIPALKMAQKVGIDHVIETARLAGIKSKLDPNLSLALGSSAISPLDMATAYSTFARDGMAIKPTVIRRIENNNGQVIDSFAEQKTRVFPPEPVAELVNVLQDVVKYGTGTQAKLADRPVAGKTGTADEGKDIWFIGFTPDLVTAVWGGNDENLPIAGHNVTGGVVMAKIWQQYNQAYYKAYPTPPGSFATYDPKLAQQKVNSLNQKQEKQPGAPAEQHPAQTAEFLQPTVEKIEEAKESSSPTPQQSQTPSYKPTVEPVVEEQSTPQPAPSLHTKEKSALPPLAPPVVHSLPPAPIIKSPTGERAQAQSLYTQPLQRIQTPAPLKPQVTTQAPSAAPQPLAKHTAPSAPAPLAAQTGVSAPQPTTTTSMATQPALQSMTASPDPSSAAHAPRRLYPYQAKSNYRPFGN